MSSNFPKINIRSKNELAKRISGKILSQDEALNLINDVLSHFDEYWYDSKKSEPEKNKYVRSAAGTKLGTLLKMIDQKILAPFDPLLPAFIFGGISGRDHISAARNLLGYRKKRTFIKVDLSTFFEQNTKEDIQRLLKQKCGCSVKGASLISKLVCVPLGKKGLQNKDYVLARGFSTSPRLAVWKNLDSFIALNHRTMCLLKEHDPRISIYVDDIGVSASNVSIEKLSSASILIQKMLEKRGLKINRIKSGSAKPFSEGVEYVGIKLGRNKLSLGTKTQKKLDATKFRLKKIRSGRKGLRQVMRGLKIYQSQLKSGKNN